MGVSRKLNEPFFVIATQNPIEQDGTYPLPEAQMDRFMFKLIVHNPSLDELMQIVSLTQKTMAEVADAACNAEELMQMRSTANQIPIAEEVLRYAMTLCSATHPDSECATQAAKKYVRLGASPRAGQALISAAKVRALLKGRFNVAYDDINELAYPVLRHRMKMNFDAIAERIYRFDEVKSVYLMSGAYDLLLLVEAHTLKELAFFVSTKLSTLETVTGTATHFVLKRYKSDGVIFEGNDGDKRLVVTA